MNKKIGLIILCVLCGGILLNQTLSKKPVVEEVVEEVVVDKEEPKEEKKKEEKVEEVVDALDLSILDAQIQQYIEETEIDPQMISYAIEDLESNQQIQSKNAKTNFIAGSVYKLPLSLLWYDKINNGEVDGGAGLQYSSSCTEKGGELENDYEMGDYIPVSTVLAYTLIYSDNVGGHILFENYGGWYQYKKDAAKYSKHKQNDEFFSLDNYLNADYMRDVMKHIYNHQDQYKDAIEYLRIASPDDYLNHNVQVDMIQKVGWYSSNVNACGLSLNGHPYVLCVFTQYNNYGLEIQGALNEICYNFFNV